MRTVATISIYLLCVYTSYAQNTWTQKVDFAGSPRLGAVAFSIGDKGYIGTGATNFSAGIFTTDFWEYDPSTGAWTQKADFGGIGRQRATGFSIGSKGYIGTGSATGFGGLLSDFWEYDPNTNGWTQRANFGGGSRYNAAGFSIGNKGYLGTGWAPGDVADFWEYDPATDTWTQKASFGGAPREAATGFSIGRKGYIGTGASSVLYADFWEYDPTLNTWSQIATLPGPARYAGVGFSIGNKGYFGTGGSGVNGATPLADLWQYDPAAGTWTQKADFGGSARNNAVGFAINDKGYIGTGANDPAPYLILLPDVWEYTAELNTITTGALTASPYCPGVNINVAFMTIGTANAGNIFTAQLSDALGSFTSPVDIGSLNATTSGTISATIPSDMIDGTAYRIRVVSSDPVVIGSDNGSDLTIATLTATITPSGTVTICRGDSVLLTANGDAGLSYQWLKNGRAIAGATSQTFTARQPGRYTVSESNTDGCTASSMATTVQIDPPAKIKPLGDPDICLTGSVVLQANTGVGFTYQWEKDRVNIAGATARRYTATEAGSYQVIVRNSSGCSNISKPLIVTSCQ